MKYCWLLSRLKKSARFVNIGSGKAVDQFGWRGDADAGCCAALSIAPTIRAAGKIVTDDMQDETRIGQYNRLRVIREVEFGVYLDGVGSGKYFAATPLCARLAARLTMSWTFLFTSIQKTGWLQQPRSESAGGRVRQLKVVAVNEVGAFLDGVCQRFASALQRTIQAHGSRQILHCVRVL